MCSISYIHHPHPQATPHHPSPIHIATAHHHLVREKCTDSTSNWRQIRSIIRGVGGSVPLSATQIIHLFSPGIVGAYVNNEGSCSKGSWDKVGARAAGFMINHTIDAIHMIAKAFCPKDPHGLVRAVFVSEGSAVGGVIAKR